MKKVRKILTAAVAAGMAAAMAGTAWAGEWKQDDKGWWYETENGNYKSGFMVEIDGEWYSFGENGYMVTGWLPDGEDWYYMDPDGARATGWREIGGKWYFFDKNGLMLRDEWKNENGKRYYFHSNGQMAVGYFEPVVKKSDRDYYWYYADPSQGGAIKKDEIVGNMKFNSTGKIYVPSEEDPSKWVALATAEEIIEATKENIETTYLGKIGRYTSNRADIADDMETEARSMLGTLVPEKELEEFIDDLRSRIMFQ